MPLVRLALLGFAFLIASLSCGRDVTSPGVNVRYARGIAWHAEFPPAYQVAGSAAAGVVDFNRVHVVLLRSDGTVALDTVVAWPAGAESETISLDVKLLPSAPSSGEPLSLSLGYINAAGDTVFKGGPVGVTATPVVSGQPPPPPVTIPVSYSGPGANAAAVQITPRSGTAVSGNSFNFTAVAVDHNGVAIPNTPIVWNTLDPSIASIPSAASGTAIAGSVRGTARIVAQLLTGPIDQVTLNVLPLPTTIALQSGSGQSGLVGSTLANPLVAFVTASDGLGVGGVTVTFAVTSGGGSVGSATAVTTDAGLAQSTWQLGSTVGTQTVSASAGTLAGSPLTYTATARSLAAAKLAVTAQPGNATAGAKLTPVTIAAQTAAGDPASAFTGAVTLALAGGTPGATLGGTVTVNAVAGVATFSNLTVNRSGTGYTLAASGPGLTGATTNSFDIATGAANQLGFTSQPASITAGAIFGDPVTVTVEDLLGNVVTSFTGSVSIGLAANPGAATLGGTKSANAVAGVATFSSLTVNRPGSGYTLAASATGLTPATSASFDVGAGAAAILQVIAGAGQSASPHSALPTPITVRVTDIAGNGVAGSTVTFAVVTGGGSLSVSSGVSDNFGRVQTVWTLGATAGSQSISATSAGLAGSPLTIVATATGVSSGSMTVFGGNNQFAVANTAVLTPPSVIVRDASNNPVSGVAVTFTAGAGSSITGPATVTSGGNGVASVGSWTLGSTGSFTLTASASGYSNVVFTGTVNTVPMSVSSAEKLPNGTQQFSVTGGNVDDTYAWSVNGTVGGNTTFGTITNTGFYTAPATVPTPSTFAVCAQSVQTPANKGCINVTITATPSAGGELIVINDINWADIGLYKSGGIYAYPGNAQFVKNLVGFTTTGVRSSASKVLMLRDSVYQANNGGYASFTADWSEVGNIITGQGYTTVETLVHSDLINIPNDVKVVILMMPGNAFATPEINGLKTFASQGGRILFIGENGSYYGYGLSIEDAFLASMGALMTNTGSCDVQGEFTVTSVPHQLTAGIAASGPGGFMMDCVSRMNLGPNDFALMTTTNLDPFASLPPLMNGQPTAVVAAIVKIDLTLYSVSAQTRQAPHPSAMRMQSSSAMSVQNPDPNARPGTAGWKGTGPPPRP